jgi:hypothetical protein
VSNHKSKTLEVPPFDALFNEPTPFQGFGQPLTTSSEVEKQFRSEAVKAQERLNKGFGVEINDQSDIPAQLDKIVAGMWAAGWNPEKGNINLFTRDLGLVLSVVLLVNYGGQPTFRSEKDVNHFSIFWMDAKIEAFPFHKALKCLYNREGESMSSFTRGIGDSLK